MIMFYLRLILRYMIMNEIILGTNRGFMSRIIITAKEGQYPWKTKNISQPQGLAIT